MSRLSLQERASVNQMERMAGLAQTTADESGAAGT